MDFSPHLLRVERDSPSPVSQAVLRVLLLLFLVIIIWAFLGRLDVVVRAEGFLLPQSRVQIVQPMEGGRIERLLVTEGEQVTAGQLLAKMDTRLTQTERTKIESRSTMARLQLQRIDAELTQGPLSFETRVDEPLQASVTEQFLANREAHRAQIKESESERERIRNQLSASQQMIQLLEESFPLYLEAEAAFDRLENSGHADRLNAMEKQKERIAAEISYNQEVSRSRVLLAELDEIELRINRISTEYRRRLVAEKIELEQELDQLLKELEKFDLKNEQSVLKSPVDGVVFDVATHTEGSVVPSGTVVLTVVPTDDQLKAEVMVKNRDVALVEPGQQARLKLLSYDFQEYGVVDARIDYVSPDAVARESADSRGSERMYRVYLDLNEQALVNGDKRFEFRPGMQIICEIKLGTRRVIDYLLSPVRKGVFEAARER